MSVVLVPTEPVAKPKKRVIIKIGSKEYCAEEGSIHHGQGYISFLDCNGNYIVVPISQQSP